MTYAPEVIEAVKQLLKVRLVLIREEINNLPVRTQEILRLISDIQKAWEAFRSIADIHSTREKEPYMTHTEMIPESARHLEHNARCCIKTGGFLMAAVQRLPGTI